MGDQDMAATSRQYSQDACFVVGLSTVTYLSLNRGVGETSCQSIKVGFKEGLTQEEKRSSQFLRQGLYGFSSQTEIAPMITQHEHRILKNTFQMSRFILVIIAENRVKIVKEQLKTRS